MAEIVHVAAQTITLSSAVTVKYVKIARHGSQNRITLTNAADGTLSVLLFGSNGMHVDTASTITAP